MTRTPSLFRNTFFISLSQGWHMLMAVVLFKVATKGFGPSGFGAYSLAMTLMYFVQLFNDFGINTLITREIAKEPSRSRSLLGVAAGTKILLIPVSLIFIGLYLSFFHYDAVTTRVILIFSLYGLITSAVLLIYGVFRGHERMDLEAGVAMAEKTLSTALGALAILLGLGLVSFSILFTSTGAVALLLALWVLKKRIHPPSVIVNLASSRLLLKDSSAFGIAMFITYFYGQLAIPMLSRLQDFQAVGIYSAAQKLMSFTSLIPAVFATAFFPRLTAVSRDRGEISRIFSLGLKYLLMIAIPLVPGVFLLSDRLILLFADGQFAESARAMRILAFAGGVSFVNVFLASLYGAANRQKLMMVFLIGALVCNIICNGILIPAHSSSGAALATLITEGLLMLVSLGWALKSMVRITETAYLVKVLAAAGIMTLFLRASGRFPLIPAVLAAVVIYFGILFALRALSVRQIKTQLIGLK
jgi:O-antigen/teichoic acid export membrane protein